MSILKRIKNFFLRINIRFGLPYIIIASFFTIIIFFTSIGITLFLYEPTQTYGVNRPLSIFLILFIPFTSIVIGIITIIKFIIDAVKKVEGAALRLIIVIMMALITVLPSIFITYISIYIIKSNLNISINKSVDNSLYALIEISRESIIDKQREMSNIISGVNSYYFYRIIRDNSLTNKFNTVSLFTNLTIVSNVGRTNITLFRSGVEPTIDINETFYNTNTIFINSEFNGKFYVNSVIPIPTAQHGKIFTNYAVWSEPMADNFVDIRNNALDAFRLYRSIDTFTRDFSTILMVLYVFILGISTFFSIIFGIALSRLITNPIGTILKAANSITNADFNIELKLGGVPDMRNLIHRFNVMARSLQYHREKENKRARLETWREAAIKVAHEIKNPLMPIMMNAELIERRVKNNLSSEDINKIKHSVNIIIKNVNTISSLIKSFSEFSFPIKLSEGKQSLNEVLKDVYESFKCYENINISLSLTKHDYFIRMDREKLIMAFTNIIKNAIEAIDPKGNGNIYISSYHDIIDTLGYFIISVTDTGVGVNETNLHRIFEPYFTSKEKGTGIGLATVEKTISEHDGSISVESIQGEGATFFIRFKIS